MATAARWSRARHQVSRLPFFTAIIHASHSNLGGAVGTFPQRFVFVFAPHSGLSPRQRTCSHTAPNIRTRIQALIRPIIWHMRLPRVLRYNTRSAAVE